MMRDQQNDETLTSLSHASKIQNPNWVMKRVKGTNYVSKSSPPNHKKHIRKGKGAKLNSCNKHIRKGKGREKT
jgi:hypothetical protein